MTAFGLFERGCEAHAGIVSEDRWAELSTYIHHRDVAISTEVDRADLLPAGRWQIIDWKTGRSDWDDETDQQLDIGHLTLRTVLQLPRDAAATVNLIAGIAPGGCRRQRTSGPPRTADAVFASGAASVPTPTTSRPATMTG